MPTSTTWGGGAASWPSRSSTGSGCQPGGAGSTSDAAPARSAPPSCSTRGLPGSTGLDPPRASSPTPARRLADRRAASSRATPRPCRSPTAPSMPRSPGWCSTSCRTRPAMRSPRCAASSRPGGTVALYVWDYAGEMELMRHFWDAAAALDPAAARAGRGHALPALPARAARGAVRDAGLVAVETRPIDVPTVFADFDDYWSPFLGGQGPAPGYCMSLPEERRAALRERLRGRCRSRRRPHRADRPGLGGPGHGAPELRRAAWSPSPGRRRSH